MNASPSVATRAGKGSNQGYHLRLRSHPLPHPIHASIFRYSSPATARGEQARGEGIAPFGEEEGPGEDSLFCDFLFHARGGEGLSDDVAEGEKGEDDGDDAGCGGFVEGGGDAVEEFDGRCGGRRRKGLTCRARASTP